MYKTIAQPTAAHFLVAISVLDIAPRGMTQSEVVAESGSHMHAPGIMKKHEVLVSYSITSSTSPTTRRDW